MNFAIGNLKYRTQALLLGTALVAGATTIVAVTSAARADETSLLGPIKMTGEVNGGILTADDASQLGGTETVVVTGYRASLEKSVVAKRNSINFTDTVFAEDIGKFPDSNIAESLNRIPGVTINRETDDEGVNVTIRGLGTSFTKVLLNNAQIAVASTGATDQTNNNREVDLNNFPTELFTQITVSKSPTADMLEGGAAGVVNMRSARPFDNPGLHITYTAQGSDYSNADSLGERGALIASDTEGPFGLLVGIAGVHNNVFTKGWEDGNAGWVTPTINTAAMCGAATGCDITGATSIGGNSLSIPTTVPAGITGNAATGPLVPGTPVNAAFLLAHNPGVTTTQLANMLVPRLGRSMFEAGSRDRYNGIVSFEYRPNDDLQFYLDFIGGRTFNSLNRSDLDWGVRAGAGSQPQIPFNVVLQPQTVTDLQGLGGVTQSADFANSQYFLEARPYKEKGDFISINPGMEWEPTDLVHVSLQANYSRSHFFRDSPTFFVVTCPTTGNAANVPGCAAPAGGVYTHFVNNPGQPFPTITTNLDLNNPANYQWNNGRVNLQDEKRYTYTDGVHADVTWGGDQLAVKAGVAFDDAFRNITAIDASQIWQNAICGDNPNVFMPSASYTPTSPAGSAAISNSQPPCQGLSNANPNGPTGPGGYPTWPGLGTGSTTGASVPVTWLGSLIPQSNLASFLKPGPTGFITVNFPAMEKASNYNAIDQAAIKAVCGMPDCTPTYPYSTTANTGGIAGSFEEKNYGTYAEANGVYNIGGRDLKYNVGLRWIETFQSVISPVSHVDPRNFGPGGTAGTQNGGVYPAFFTFSDQKHTYTAFLPSANFVYDFLDDAQLRFSISRTMTRPFPSQMIAVVNFSDLTAQNASLGNPGLKPFFSNNYEVGVNYFTGGEGFIGIDVFRKDVSNYFQNVTVTQPFGYLAQFDITYDTLNTTQQTALTARTGCTSQATCATGATITVTQPQNLPGLLNIDGVELDYVQPLDVWLEQFGLKGFGFSGNLTMLNPTSSGAAGIHPQGVAPWSYNLTGYYEDNGIMFRAQYNWSARVYASNSNQQGVCLPNTTAQAKGCPQGTYLFGASRGQLDISSSLELSRLFGDLPSDPYVTLEVQNITDEPIVSYDQFKGAVHAWYDPGRLILFGIRGTW